MAIKKKAVTSEVLTMASIDAMTQKDRIASFVDKDRSSGRIIIEMGKLYRSIEANLPKSSRGIFPTLIEAGVKKGTLSNASYVAKTFDLVTGGHLTEDEFNTFTVRDCQAVTRTMSKASTKPLTASEIAAIVREFPDFEPELESYYEHGESSAAVAFAKSNAAAEQAAADAAAAQAAANAQADAAAQLEALRAQNAALTAAAAAETPAPAPETPEPQAPAPQAIAPAPEPTETEPAETPAPVEAPVAPATKITPIQKPARTAADICADLDRLFAETANLEDGGEQAVIAAKIIEMANLCAESGMHIAPALVAA